MVLKVGLDLVNCSEYLTIVSKYTKRGKIKVSMFGKVRGMINKGKGAWEKFISKYEG